mmetsp:Transcript_37642/g.57376  ORF Transcript_37642/g.57376 Transcript_37642/m.57376 type:complete len:179 (+) Transcript_37642:99-635(+)
MINSAARTAARSGPAKRTMSAAAKAEPKMHKADAWKELTAKRPVDPHPHVSSKVFLSRRCSVWRRRLIFPVFFFIYECTNDVQFRNGFYYGRSNTLFVLKFSIIPTSVTYVSFFLPCLETIRFYSPLLSLHTTKLELPAASSVSLPPDMDPCTSVCATSSTSRDTGNKRMTWKFRTFC